MNMERNSIHHPYQSITMPSLLVHKMLNDVVTWYIFWPVPSFLMSAAAKRPLFLNSTMAFNTQKPESNTNTLPVDQTGFVNHRSKPVIFPRSSNSFGLRFVGWAFPL